jgi:hypothetical protein
LVPLDAEMSGICSRVNSVQCARWRTASRTLCLLSKHFTKPVVLWQYKHSFGGNSTRGGQRSACTQDNVARVRESLLCCPRNFRRISYWTRVHMKTILIHSPWKWAFIRVSRDYAPYRITNIPYIKIVACFSEHPVVCQPINRREIGCWLFVWVCIEHSSSCCCSRNFDGRD